MAKAKIVNHIADSKYSVIFYHDMVRINQYIESFTAYKNKADSDVIRYEGTLEDLKIAATDFQALLNQTTNDYIECLRTDGEDFQDCQEIKAEVTKVNEHYMTALNNLTSGEIMLSTAETRVARATAELERLNALTGEEEMEIWCADLCDRPEGQAEVGYWVGHSPIIPTDTIVATIDVFNFETRVYDHWIVPSADDRDNTYDEELNGISANVLSNNGNAFVYNINMRGPQAAWNPYFRLATISGVNELLLDVDYDELKDYSGITYNTQDEEKNKDIGIDYCYCPSGCYTADPFEVGDKVIVKFNGDLMTEAQVIGYQNNPKACESYIYGLISQTSILDEVINFYKISDPADNTQFIAKNDLQISENANSHTWSEFDVNGNITRQLATVITNLIPVDYQHSTDGLPYKINVILAGQAIAKISTVELSRHLEDFNIFRRSVSPAFFYKDAQGIERIGVITATMQNPETGVYTGHCDVSRWSAEYDPAAAQAVELIESETVQLAATGILKQLITLNIDGSNGAFAAQNKGYVLESVNAPVFSPTVRIAVDVPSENPEYVGETVSGSGTKTFDISYLWGKLFLRYYSWDGDSWRTRCSFSGNITATTTEVTEVESSTISDYQTSATNSGSLIAFGYDILIDTFNVIIDRPAKMEKESNYTNNYILESYSCPDVAAEDPNEYSNATSDRKQTYSENTIEKHSIEFHNVPETASELNPIGGTVLIDEESSQDRMYRKVIVEEYGTTVSEDITESYSVVSEELVINETVDIATGTLQVQKWSTTTLNTSKTLTKTNYFLDGRKSEQIILEQSQSTTAFDPPQLPFNAGTKTNIVNTPGEAYLPIRYNGDCEGLPSRSGDPCPEIPDSCGVYGMGTVPGTSVQIGGGYPEPYVETWDFE